MKTALILSGGGFKGAFQAGAILALIEKEITIDLISGISVGALNGALVATNNKTAMYDFWNKVALNGANEIYTEEYISIKAKPILKWQILLKGALKGFSWFSLLKKETRMAFLNKIIDIKGLTTIKGLLEKLKIIKLDDFCVPFICGATSLYDSTLHIKTNSDFSSDVEFQKFLASSANLPIICNPIDMVITNDGYIQDLVDGGIRCVVPIKQTIEYIKNLQTEDNWRFIIINCNSEILPPEKCNNILEIVNRSLNDITINQIFQNDLKHLELVNKLVKASGKDNIDGYKMYEVILISPKGINVGTTLDCSKEIIEKRFELGYNLAKKMKIV